jgi:hypothetical protein
MLAAPLKLVEVEMAKLEVFDNKQEMEKPMDMTQGGGKPVGPSVKEHNAAAMSSRDYPKKGQTPGSPNTGEWPSGDLRGDTSKPLC